MIKEAMRTYLARQERNIFGVGHVLFDAVVGGGEVEDLLDAERVILRRIQDLDVTRLNC